MTINHNELQLLYCGGTKLFQEKRVSHVWPTLQKIKIKTQYDNKS
jgi:hypothetical protein